MLKTLQGNGKHLYNVAASIRSFIEVVVLAIQVAKDQTAATSLSLSTLATFVSTVTGALLP
jgi:hypothetical protein